MKKLFKKLFASKKTVDSKAEKSVVNNKHNTVEDIMSDIGHGENEMGGKSYFLTGRNIVLSGIVANPSVHCIVKCDELLRGRTSFPCISNLKMCKLEYCLTTSEVNACKMIACMKQEA